MKIASILRAVSLWLALGTPVLATTYGSVEPIATPDVIDTGVLRDQRLEVRAAFAERLLQCGIVDQVIDVLRSNKSVKTINGLNAHFEVGAGGFAGATNPSFVYTLIDSGPNAATHAEISILTDSLGYVVSQGSAILLDAINTTLISGSHGKRSASSPTRTVATRVIVRCAGRWPSFTAHCS